MLFLKSAWTILVGVKDALVLLFLLLFFLGLYALLSSAPNPGAVRDGALLIAIDGVVSEQPVPVDPRIALLGVQPPLREYRQRDIIRALDLAVANNQIKAVVLDLSRFMGGGQASLSAIGDRLDAVKKAGKPVYVFAASYADDGYQLAAHASEIWLDPMGGVIPTGPGGAQTYYKGLLDQLGVKAHIYRVGTYKSAIEPFLRTGMSPEAREATQAIYDEIWEQWRADIVSARPKANLDALIAKPGETIENVKGNLAQYALTNGLVDRLGTRIAFGTYLAGKLGKDRNETIGGFAATSPEALMASRPPDHNGSPIGVITVAGNIVDGKAEAGTAAGDTIAALILDALKDEDLKALVVRVDSPGGSVTASETIRTALNEAKNRKLPIVVSMANVAASGGYWVATPADTIFAEPATITGSIGIFGVIPSGKDALAKWGVTSDGVKTTPLSGEPNVLGGVGSEFDRVAQSVIEKGYRDFLDIVAASRKKTPEQIDAIAQGRVWAGGTARQLGLVDRLGGLDDALAEAARLAKLGKGEWHARYFEPAPDFTNGLLGGFVHGESSAAPIDMFSHIAWEQQMTLTRIRADLDMLVMAKGAQARCLECSVAAGVPVAADLVTTGWLNWLFEK